MNYPQQPPRPHYPPVPYPQPPVMQQPYIPQRSVSVQERRTAWGFHILMTFCTLGLWLFVWIPYAIIKAMTPKKKTITYNR